ncbi:MAG: hypothetical protein ACKVW3_12990 [Phycisphaerales bacterium]
MPIFAPTASITVGDKTTVVTFDFDRLVAIEAATGRTLIQMLSDFASYSPDAEEGQKPTQAAMLAAVERFSLTATHNFVIGCVGKDVARSVPLNQFRDVFDLLLAGFVEAVRQLNGKPKDDAKADPQPAPQASAT